MTQPTRVVGFTTNSIIEFTSPLAGYTLQSLRRCMLAGLLLR